MLRLYDYDASGNCYKVRLLLAQLGLAYERVPIDIFGGDTLTDDYASINPLRSTPVLELDDGRRLVESNAILFYLASGTPMLPDEPIDRAEVVRWLIYEQTDVMPAIGGLRFRLMTGRLRPDDADALARRNNGEQLLTFLDRQLSATPFLAAARYTIADIAVFGYLHRGHEAGYEMERWPAIQAWIDRIAGQPGYVNDLVPYGPNAGPGVGRSIYG